MERLTAYGYGEIVALVLLASLVLIAQSAVFCYAAARLPRRRSLYLLPEAAALAVSLLVVLLLGGGWKLFLMELSPDGWLAPQRYAAGLLALTVGLTSSCERRLLPGLLLAFAGLCTLPPMDAFLPLSAILILALLGVRLMLLAMRARSTHDVTIASIRAGLDLLPEGILFGRTGHAAALVNIAMLQFMERLLGRQYRSAEEFWAALTAFDAPAVAEKHARRDAFLFRFAQGDTWLVQRTHLTSGLDGWQLTAGCVTEFDAVSQELEAKNAALADMVDAQKELLTTLEETERHRTLQEITSRVHDVLGQRISMLQQLLASPAPKDALDTIVRIDSLLEAVPLAQEVHPATLLADLTDTYRRLGIRLTVTGSLPRNLRRARAFAAIIREALSNAVCHGRANAVTITLGERQLRIRDNGIGCRELRLGGGLSGMMRRVNELGGRLLITQAPHFEIEARIGEKRQ